VVLFVGCAGDAAREPIQPLVDAAWLSSHLGDVAILDVRYGAPEGADRAAFESGHIPGAVFAGYRAYPWVVERDSVPMMMPPIEDLEQLIGGFGVSNDDHVVIVTNGTSAGNMGSAARIYWQLTVLGHDRVSILNGGFASWEEGGYPVETGWIDPEPKDFEAQYRPELVAATSDVVEAQAAGTPLIDARSPTYFSGERKSGIAARHGTIMGAENLPAQICTVEDGGTFIDATLAAESWRAASVPVEGEQIMFCNGGYLAAVTWFTAYAILGNKEARLYDASLAEWSADPELPMTAELEPAVN
jgi:thiosulfate/3-mercaptopyruvate sulfurtransferase